MSRKLPVLMLFTAFALLLATAGCYHRSQEQRVQGIVNSMADKLDLNDAQKARLNAMKQETLARFPAMKSTREESYDELIAIMRSTQVDQQKMRALAERNKAQADDFISFFSAKFTEFHDMLTPEQREKAAVEMERWREHERAHSPKGGGKGQK